MNRSFLFALVAALLLFNSGCSTLSLTTDYNPEYDFATLKSYAWLDTGQAPSGDARINNALIIERVHKAVDQTLAARGYVKTDSGAPDFVVSWLGAIDKKLRVDTIDHFYSPYGYGSLYRDPYWAGPMPVTRVHEYEVGTLIIDILDPVRHRLIWRGTGEDRLRGNRNPEQVTKAINTAVAAIMKNFPPPK